MKKTYTRSIILLLLFAVLTGLAIHPVNSLAEDPLTVSMTLDKSGVIQAGESVKVTLTPSNGRPPYIYRHMITISERDEEYYLSSEDGPDNTATWTIHFGDSVKLKGIVWDADGRIASHEMTLSIQGSVYNPIIITNQSFSHGDSVNIGDTITYSINAEGGLPPYSYYYKLTFLQGEDWALPIDGGPYTSNSLSYTVTRGSEGIIYSAVADAAGRQVGNGPAVRFTIHGDNRHMKLTATHGMKKIKGNTYRMSIQANLEGGSLPTTYYCRWLQYKDGKLVNKIYNNNTDGAFTLESDIDKVTAILYARDAEGWTCGEEISIEFDAADLAAIIRFDLLRKESLLFSLKEEMERRWLYDQLKLPPETMEPSLITPVRQLIPALPRLDPPKVTLPVVRPPEIVVPKVPAPEAPAPEVPAPEVPAPEIPATDILNPKLPPPNIPGPEVPSLPRPRP